MTEEELVVAINFRTIDVPCCGNCKWFIREWEHTYCGHPQNIWHLPEKEFSEYNYKIYCNKEHNICNRFVQKEK